MTGRVYDCIIIGAGPGGLQAAIYLGRYNRDVLLLDRSGGRTWHAKRIENVLTHRAISGSEIVELGIEQAKSFQVDVRTERVKAVGKENVFVVSSAQAEYRSRYVIAASGVIDVLPRIKDLHRFLGVSYFTCIDCDGHKTTGKKLVVLGDSMTSVNLALAMKKMYSPDVTLIASRFAPPDSATEVLMDEGIRLVRGEPIRIKGEQEMESLELANGEQVPCEAIMASFGIRLNDEYLAGLQLKKDAEGFKYAVNSVYESSLSGLYIVGPLNTGQDQVVIAAGEGAVAAIDINKRLLNEQDEIGAVCKLGP